MAAAADGKEKSAGGGGIVVPLIILTVIGGGLGVGSKLFLFNDADETEQVATVKESPDVAKKKAEKKGKKGYGDDASDKEAGGEDGDKKADDGKINEIIGLDPIIASLAKSSGAWVRLETAIVFKSEPEAGFTAVKSEIASDILAYLRTVSLDQIQGASGLEYLTDDLQDIARVRSQGAVDRLVIKGLIFE
ncbi:MAG: flagellar basal body-associated FliL family protein [Filomicrobium sp.]